MGEFDFPKDEIEFGRQWSGCAGEHHAWEQAKQMANKEAADCFVADKVEMASAFRRLAKEFELHAQSSGRRLEAFIKEGVARGR